ncbi:MAG: glycosyltransferase family 4 protein [Hyphomicrobiales bacterium]
MITGPLRICHAFLFFSIRFAGGTSDLMFKICKAQEKQKHHPIVYSGDYKFDSELADKLPKTRFRILKSWFDKAGFSIMPGLAKQLHADRNQIDIVHMHVFRTFQNLILYKFCRRNNIPYVIDAHGAVPYYHRKNLIKKLFDRIWGRKMLNDAEFLIAETEVGVQEYLDIDASLNRENIAVISPPFDTDEFETLPTKGLFRAEHRISPDQKVIMFLGRVHHIKGNDFLIEGFAELCKKRQDCLLVIVGGDDGHMDDCKTLAEKLCITDKVKFTGFIGGADKNSALIDADIVAQMSRQEQGAWAPFEAVLCGTPIVVTDHTGAGEDVRRVDAGETVEFGNAPALASVFNDILDNYATAKTRTLKAKNYIETKMSMNARAQEYIDIYESAIAKRRGF